MNLMGCVGAVWILMLIVVVAIWPAEEHAAAIERCEDIQRIQHLELEALRGSVALLGCPGDPGHAAQAPAGEGALLMGRAIDIDAASEAELRALPGIGPGLARRIARDRDENGSFGSLDALSRVKGLGPGRVKVLRGWATTNGEGAPPPAAGKSGRQ